MSSLAQGGARIRTGRPPDPNSGRSDKHGLSFTALPSAGYAGVPPPFPIPDDFGDEELRTRELTVWEDAWTSPQAHAWALQPWRHRIIAQYCRVSALVELAADPGPGLITQLHRYRDQLGLTPAGLLENGWVIEVSDDAGGSHGPVVPPKRKTSRDRMKVNIKVVEGGDK